MCDKSAPKLLPMDVLQLGIGCGYGLIIKVNVLASFGFKTVLMTAGLSCVINGIGGGGWPSADASLTARMLKKCRGCCQVKYVTCA